MTRGHERRIWAAWVVAWLLALRLGVATWRASSLPANGFVTHWTASRLVLQGADVQQFYDDAWFSARVHRVEPTVYDIFGANPPTVAAAAVPVAWMSYPAARLSVAMLSVVVWIGGAAWLGRVLLPGSLLAPLLVLLAALFEPAEEGLRHAQLHIAVFGLVLVAWWLGRRASRVMALQEAAGGDASSRDEVVVGAAFGAALALKAVGVMFWIMLLAQRRWKALLGAIGAVAVVALLCLPVAGPGAWRSFVARAGSLSASGAGSVTAYQSLPTLIRRLTVASTSWNPRPLVGLGSSGVALSWLCVIGLIVVSAVTAARRSRADDATFAAFSVLSLIASPVTIDYHYTLALVPIAILLSRTAARPTLSRSALLALATFLIAARLPYLSPRWNDGALTVFAFPKLYGALMLWWLAVTEPVDRVAARIATPAMDRHTNA